MLPRFSNPAALSLLLCLPLLYWWCRKSLSGLSRTRQLLALAIRSLLMILLILALAGLQMVRLSDDLTVYFVLDQSKSIPVDLRSEAFHYLTEAASNPKRGKQDEAGLIVFGGNAGIEVSPTPLLKVTDVHTVLHSGATDVAGALRLATAAFPENTQKRIVLITDGNENRGNAAAEAQNAKASGIVVDVLPLEYARGVEVLVDKVILPTEVLPEEEFEIKVVVQAFQATRAKLRLYENDQLIADQPVEVFPDRPNVFSVTRTLETPDFYTFEAVIEPEDDTIADNNRGYGFVDVRGEAKILFITGDATGDEYLAQALKEEGDKGFRVHVGGVSDIPVTPSQMQRWDLLILSNVPASAMTGGKNSQMAMIRDAVKTSGIGLIMVGGDNSFGAGGFKGTEIEEALPVEMDVTQKKVLPSGALALVMDAVEFANGNAWAREICKAALDGISTRDKIAIYSAGGWFLPMMVASDKAAIRAKVEGIQATDEMPDAGLRASYEVLQNTSAGIKHVVIISDSGCSQNIGGLLTEMVSNKITISAVVIGPHTPQMAQNMEYIAERGQGNFYYPKNPEALPAIFFKEAAVVKKSLIWDKEPFQPKLDYSTTPLSGIAGEQLPPLLGYVVTTAKISPLVGVPLLAPHGEGDPIFAHWRYGLGKAVAFTSDAKNRWAKEWVAWPEFSRFWAQTARWSMRQSSGWDYHVQARIDGSEGRIVVDAIDDKGEFQNFLEINGTVTSPDIKNQELKLSQTGPGRYDGSFRADQVGTYIVNLVQPGKQEGTEEGPPTFRTGVAVSYSPEYRQFETNHALLKQVVEATGGRLLGRSDNVFEHNLPPTEVSKPLWRGLLMAALCLFPFDVFVRRVMIDYDRVLAVLQAILARLPILGERWKRRPQPQAEAMQRLLQRKREVRQATASAAVTPRDFSALDAPSDAGGGPAGPSASPAVPRIQAPAAGPKPPSPEPEPSSYTQRLLAAKKRAMKKEK